MSDAVYRYTFPAKTPIDEVEVSLLLAVLAVECLHGEAQVCLDSPHSFDPQGRTCVIDAATPVGQDLNRLFTGLLRREFGAGTFQVERVGAAAPGGALASA